MCVCLGMYIICVICLCKYVSMYVCMYVCMYVFVSMHALIAYLCVVIMILRAQGLRPQITHCVVTKKGQPSREGLYIPP